LCEGLGVSIASFYIFLVPSLNLKFHSDCEWLWRVSPFLVRRAATHCPSYSDGPPGGIFIFFWQSLQWHFCNCVLRQLLVQTV
jgi:hypothetical protein